MRYYFRRPERIWQPSSNCRLSHLRR